MGQALLEEKVEEEEAFRTKMAVTAANREQRKPTKRRAEDGREKVLLPSKGQSCDELQVIDDWICDM